MFLATGLPGTLQEVEDAVVAYEQMGSVSRAAEAVRPGSMSPERKDPITLEATMRWLRRRVAMVRVALFAVMGLLPEQFKGCQVSLLRAPDPS